jgi:uncharacterized membrane protein YbhN (UPF0104 family)
MLRKTVQLLLSLSLAGLFIWLSIRDVDLGEWFSRIGDVRTGWLWLFAPVMLFSHWLRAVRSKMLLEGEGVRADVTTLYAGVMLGYFMNLVLPRLGEVSRPVYVARRTGVGSGMMIGTILLERLIDLLILMGLFLAVVFTLVSDRAVINAVFGTDRLPTGMLAGVIAVAVLIPVGFFGLYVAMNRFGGSWKHHPGWAGRLYRILESFTSGIISIRNVPHWPYFIGSTAGIWFCYILMTFIPFSMLDLGGRFDLGLREAVVITMVASVGVTIPTPAGIGTFHLFVQQGLHQLYGVPLVEGLTYAAMMHAANILLILLSCPVLLWMDKRLEAAGSDRGAGKHGFGKSGPRSDSEKEGPGPRGADIQAAHSLDGTS